MIIKKAIIDKIYEEHDMLKVIESKVEMHKKGANYVGKSPFVEEKTPSFTVSQAKGVWKDFSSGEGSNNGISFLMHFGMTWIEAIKEVADICDIALEYEESSEETEKYIKKTERRAELSLLATSAIKQYHKAFLELPLDHPAKIEVFEKRKYTDQIVADYQIGYAPGTKFIYDKCLEVAKIEDAREIGLISESHNRDFLVDRVVYPFQTTSKKFPILGMAGRRLKDEKKYAKWMNSKTSDLYDKSVFWYGMDKALASIIKSKEAWIVEGYNDTIAMQTNGFLNTVSSSGTSISERQVKELSKYCEKVTLCLDGDGPGIKSMITHVQTFIKHGLRVFVKIIKDKLDPDEFVRSKNFNAKTFVKDFEDSREDGFKFLMAEKFKDKDEVEKATEAKVLLELILSLGDEGIIAIYSKWLSKESGVSVSNINKWSKDFVEALEKNKVNEIPAGNDWMYLLPKEVKQPITELKETIQKYQMFTANNKVWIMNHSAEPPYTFHAVTNFDIRVIQHMQDEKFPKKLIWMKNVYGQEVIYDVLSSDLNTPLSFENMVTNQGKFMWKGDRKDHQVLKFYLMENMGTGRMIEVMGWQPEGFWCWNNQITIPANAEEKTPEKSIVIDGNGVFTHKDVSYYIPSANKIYKNNLYKFESQKKLRVKETKNTFYGYTAQMLKVHREHAMIGILFTISSMFQDIVVNEIGGFPILFLYGPPSSGKDQLAECCQSFFGTPQTAINLEGGVSTIKAQVREFAQFANIISHLSEYKNGDPSLDGVLKGIWDRRGYKRGNIDSHVGTDSIPILSAAILTGNYYPDSEALITRLISNIMDVDSYSADDTKEYEALADMTKKGVSGLSLQFINQRDKVQNEFKTKFREFKAILSERNPDAKSRMLTNLAVLGSFYQVFSDVVSFPFTAEQMLTQFNSIIDKQMNKLNSASLVNRFWECFLAVMRSGQKNEQIRLQRDYKVVGDKMYFNFTNCFSRVQRHWYTQFKGDAPGKDQMMNALKKDNCFVEAVKGTRMAPGRYGKSTSAYVVILSEIQISDEIMSNMHFQAMEDKLTDNGNDGDTLFNSPVTP